MPIMLCYRKCTAHFLSNLPVTQFSNCMYISGFDQHKGKNLNVNTQIIKDGCDPNAHYYHINFQRLCQNIFKAFTL